MKIEIERKFLLASDGWRARVRSSERIRDGLLSSQEDKKVRVRIIGARATLTVKTGRVRGVREEFEYPIPLADAERLMSLCGSDVLEKVRHYVEHAAVLWEIDLYEGLLSGVALAEVELESRGQVLDLPDWIGREVTDDPAFRKVNMMTSRQGRSAED